MAFGAFAFAYVVSVVVAFAVGAVACCLLGLPALVAVSVIAAACFVAVRSLSSRIGRAMWTGHRLFRVGARPGVASGGAVQPQGSQGASAWSHAAARTAAPESQPLVVERGSLQPPSPSADDGPAAPLGAVGAVAVGTGVGGGGVAIAVVAGQRARGALCRPWGAAAPVAVLGVSAVVVVDEVVGRRTASAALAHCLAEARRPQFVPAPNGPTGTSSTSSGVRATGAAASGAQRGSPAPSSSSGVLGSQPLGADHIPVPKSSSDAKTDMVTPFFDLHTAYIAASRRQAAEGLWGPEDWAALSLPFCPGPPFHFSIPSPCAGPFAFGADTLAGVAPGPSVSVDDSLRKLHCLKQTGQLPPLEIQPGRVKQPGPSVEERRDSRRVVLAALTRKLPEPIVLNLREQPRQSQSTRGAGQGVAEPAQSPPRASALASVPAKQPAVPVPAERPPMEPQPPCAADVSPESATNVAVAPVAAPATSAAQAATSRRRQERRIKNGEQRAPKKHHRLCSCRVCSKARKEHKTSQEAAQPQVAPQTEPEATQKAIETGQRQQPQQEATPKTPPEVVIRTAAEIEVPLPAPSAAGAPEPEADQRPQPLHEEVQEAMPKALSEAETHTAAAIEVPLLALATAGVPEPEVVESHQLCEDVRNVDQSHLPEESAIKGEPLMVADKEQVTEVKRPPLEPARAAAPKPSVSEPKEQLCAVAATPAASGIAVETPKELQPSSTVPEVAAPPARPAEQPQTVTDVHLAEPAVIEGAAATTEKKESAAKKWADDIPTESRQPASKECALPEHQEPAKQSPRAPLMVAADVPMDQAEVPKVGHVAQQPHQDQQPQQPQQPQQRQKPQQPAAESGAPGVQQAEPVGAARKRPASAEPMEEIQEEPAAQTPAAAQVPVVAGRKVIKARHKIPPSVATVAAHAPPPAQPAPSPSKPALPIVAQFKLGSTPLASELPKTQAVPVVPTAPRAQQEQRRQQEEKPVPHIAPCIVPQPTAPPSLSQAQPAPRIVAHRSKAPEQKPEPQPAPRMVVRFIPGKATRERQSTAPPSLSQAPQFQRLPLAPTGARQAPEKKPLPQFAPRIVPRSQPPQAPTAPKAQEQKPVAQAAPCIVAHRSKAPEQKPVPQRAPRMVVRFIPGKATREQPQPQPAISHEQQSPMELCASATASREQPAAPSKMQATDEGAGRARAPRPLVVPQAAEGTKMEGAPMEVVAAAEPRPAGGRPARRAEDKAPMDVVAASSPSAAAQRPQPGAAAQTEAAAGRAEPSDTAIEAPYNATECVLAYTSATTPRSSGPPLLLPADRLAAMAAAAQAKQQQQPPEQAKGPSAAQTTSDEVDEFEQYLLALKDVYGEGPAPQP
eukprot:m51a1_g5131 hypothetical protein (1354) ;mRNA; f:408387-413217